MDKTALWIVLFSAFLHAGWNLLLKRSERKLVFVWWFLLLSAVLYLPMLLWFLPGLAIPPSGWLCIVASGLIHGVYFTCMGIAYQRGDLSLVYPLARGSGPLFVPLLAAWLLSERISWTGGAGIALIVAGAYALHLRSLAGRAFWEPFGALRGGASLWALFTGLAIASYTLVDKVGVGLVPPPVYIYAMLAVTWLAITPWVLIVERDGLMPEWRRRKGAIAAAGFLCTFTYLLVLIALSVGRVSYVAAVREVSIVLSAWLGIAVLGESHGPQKLLGAVLIVVGVVVIGLSR